MIQLNQNNSITGTQMIISATRKGAGSLLFAEGPYQYDSPHAFYPRNDVTLHVSTDNPKKNRI